MKTRSTLKPFLLLGLIASTLSTCRSTKQINSGAEFKDAYVYEGEGGSYYVYGDSANIMFRLAQFNTNIFILSKIIRVKTC